MSGVESAEDSKLRSEASSQREIARPDLVVALDAIYGYATDPDNWKEMTDLLTQVVSDSDDDMRDLIEGLRVHLGRAEVLARRLHENGAVEDFAPNYCHMTVGRDMRVIDIAEGAAVLLRPFCGLLEAGARLSFADPENAARFRDLAATIERGGENGAAKGDAPALLRLVSETGEEAAFGYLIAESRLPESLRRQLRPKAPTGKGTLVFVAPEREAARDAVRMYRETFGLTPAEARLAARLKDGLSLKEAAVDLGISVNTARNQIRSIFDKLGVNRQSDLIRHLTELSQLAAYIQADLGASGFKPIDSSGLSRHAPRRFFGLPDGRRLCYREHGVADGRPVLMLRSTLNSSLVRPGETKAALDLGLRLICIEHPGAGLSSFDPSLSFESFARDIELLVDDLGLDAVHISATASAAWFGMAVAARLGPRVRRLLLTRPRLSVPQPEKDRGMASYFFGNLRRHPWLLDSTLFILRAKMSRPLMRSLIFHFFEKSPVDFALMERDPALVEDLLDSILESLDAGYRGLLQEGELFLEGRFPDLSTMVAPLVVWYGEADGIVPPADIMADLDRFGIEAAEMRGFPGLGHFFENHRQLLEHLTAP